MARLSPALHRVAVAGTAVAALALAGCSESTSSPTREIAPDAPSLSQNFDVLDETGRHVFRTKPWFENDARNDAGRGRPGGSGTGISYHGGPVLQAKTTVVAIYWSSKAIFNGGPTPPSTGAGTGDGSLVGYFMRNLGGSSYFNINTTYTDGSGKAIANVVDYKAYWANNTNAPVSGASVSDQQMLNMLSSGFASGAITYDPNTLYAIFTDDGVNLGGGFGTQYCAYHYHGSVTVNGATKTALYSAMPYNYTYQGACTNGTASPNDDPAADAEVNTLAHEIEETTTDLMGNAWFDNRGYENADKCAWNWGSTYTLTNGGVANIKVGQKDFLVQMNWVNANSGGCAKAWP